MGLAVMAAIASSWIAPGSMSALLVASVCLVGILAFYAAATILAPRQLSNAEERLAEVDERGVRRSLRDRHLYRATSLSMGDKS